MSEDSTVSGGLSKRCDCTTQSGEWQSAGRRGGHLFLPQPGARREEKSHPRESRRRAVGNTPPLRLELAAARPPGGGGARSREGSRRCARTRMRLRVRGNAAAGRGARASRTRWAGAGPGASGARRGGEGRLNPEAPDLEALTFLQPSLPDSPESQGRAGKGGAAS